MIGLSEELILEDYRAWDERRATGSRLRGAERSELDADVMAAVRVSRLRANPPLSLSLRNRLIRKIIII